ncbi:MAG: transposase [Puniceicoccales bacterium]|jgi:hypothetical protein|nr:transposase [Puniceicoccales bacterium]
MDQCAKFWKSFLENCPNIQELFYGFKVHIVTNDRGSEVVNFRFSNGSDHDVRFLEEMFQNLTGTGIGDSGYVSSDRAERLKKMNCASLLGSEKT